MFSGIIAKISKPTEVKKNKASMELFFPTIPDWKLELGESINIDGVCSTVKEITKSGFSVFYMPETIKKTALSSLTQDHVYNLERCLSLKDLIGGHLVYGHVDTTGEVKDVEKGDDEVTITFKISSEFTRYIVYKGSIAVNGVSLTVIKVTSNSFSVSLIPHTLKHTNLGQLKENDLVNIEVDMMAKHLEKLLRK